MPAPVSPPKSRPLSAVDRIRAALGITEDVGAFGQGVLSVLELLDLLHPETAALLRPIYVSEIRDEQIRRPAKPREPVYTEAQYRAMERSRRRLAAAAKRRNGPKPRRVA